MEKKMVKYVYLGFRDGKILTVILSNSELSVEDAMDCDYWIHKPQEARKQVETWLADAKLE